MTTRKITAEPEQNIKKENIYFDNLCETLCISIFREDLYENIEGSDGSTILFATSVLKDGYEIVRAKLYTLASRYVGNFCLHYEPNCTFTQRDTTKQCKTRVQIWARTSNGTFRCFSVLRFHQRWLAGPD